MWKGERYSTRRGNSMLSIIIPTLNEEKYIEPLLKSLVPQLEKGDEILIVDSLSRDGTLRIAKKYSCKILPMPRKGIAAAKNLGARKAANDVIAFLDADSVVSRNWLKKIKRPMQDKKLQAVAGLDLYHADSRRKETFYNGYSRSLYHAAHMFYRFSRKAWLPANNCAIRKKLFLGIGGYRNVVCEDAEFMQRWPLNARVHYDPSMIVWLSDRRFKKHGFRKTLSLWLIADVKAWLGLGIHAQEYKKI